MREEENLRLRLAKLRSTAAPNCGIQDGGGGDAQDVKGLRERLNVSSTEQASSSESEYGNRLSALLSEREPETSDDDLAARLARLGDAPNTAVRPSSYEVPPGETEEVEDLDDLLEELVEGLPRGQRIATDLDEGEIPQRTSEIEFKQLDQKLQNLGEKTAAMLAQVVGDKNSDSKMSDQERAELRAMEAFLGRDTKAGDGEGGNTDALSDEEHRLFAMIADEMRVEGHGITAPLPNPASEKADELWLPIAPTAPPVPCPYKTTTGPTQTTPSARIIAEQAMDEARLGLSSVGSTKGTRSSGKMGGSEIRHGDSKAAAGSRGAGDDVAGDVWCSICSDDATLRCRECEEDDGVEEDEPELFCARCFKEIHRGDPELKSHRPLAASKLRNDKDKPRKRGANIFGKWNR